MEKKTDLRIVKTYTALTNAFMELIKEKKIEDITVNELCERAIIRRTTFYKHFADKYEFINFLIRRIQQENINVLDILEPNKPREFYETIINNIFEEMEGNEQFALSLSKSSMLPLLLDMFAEHVASVLEESFQKLEKSGISLPAEPDFLSQIVTGGLIQCSKWWFTQKERISKEKMKQQLLSLVLQINEIIGSGFSIMAP